MKPGLPSASALLPVLFVAAGCAAAPIGVSTGEIAIPGPWDPPPDVRATAATQWVDVVDPPTISPLGRCTSTDPFACSCSHPACSGALEGTREVDAFLRARYPFLRSGGLYCCRQNSTRGTTTLSVHAIGRAIDLMVPMTGGDADNTRGDEVANYLVENAEHFGIQRVIWDRAFWNGERGFGLLSSASLPHTDHLHIEMSVDGAARRTAFFTAGPPAEGCEAHCEGTRLVGADCSTVDCAAAGGGATCLNLPARCGVPEPLTSMRNASASLPAATVTAPLARFSFTAPRRLFDTRSPSPGLTRSDGASSGPLGGSRTGTFGDFGIAGATGVWLNVAVVPTASTYVTAFTAGTTRPLSSTVNATPPRVRANAASVTLGAGGVTFFSLADAEVIADLYGSFGPTGAGLRTAGPNRVFDSRSSGMTLPAGAPVMIDVRAPADAVGVVASVAAIGQATSGFLVGFDCAGGAPGTSHVNFDAGRVSANAIAVPITGGQLCLQSNTEVHVVVDVTGYLVAAGELSYQALAPVRLLDTRDPASLWVGRLGDGQTIELPVGTMAGMPAGAAAVTVNLTSVSPTVAGFVTAYPCGATLPETSSLNYDTDGAVGAQAIVPLGTGGGLCLYARTRTDLVVDLSGVWVPTPGTTPAPGPGPDEHPDDPDDPGLPTTEADGGVTDGDGGTVVLPDGGTPVGERDAGGDPRGALGAGCSCHVGGSGRAPLGALVLALVLGGLARRRR